MQYLCLWYVHMPDANLSGSLTASVLRQEKGIRVSEAQTGFLRSSSSPSLHLFAQRVSAESIACTNRVYWQTIVGVWPWHTSSVSLVWSQVSTSTLHIWSYFIPSQIFGPSSSVLSTQADSSCSKFWMSWNQAVARPPHYEVGIETGLKDCTMSSWATFGPSLTLAIDKHMALFRLGC